MPTEGYVQIPPNSTGTQLRLFNIPSTTIWMEGIVEVDAEGNLSTAAESPQLSVVSSANLAAGASVSLDSSDITTSKIGQLVGVTIAASVPLKAQIQTVSGGATTRDTIFTSDARLTYHWRPPFKNWIQLTGGAGIRFRTVMTNLDNIDTADVYATFYWDEV